MIRVEGLFYRYDREPPDVLRGVNVLFSEGEHTALIGPNGCGKTTLIKHLNALLFPAAGSVSVDGMKTTDALGPGDPAAGGNGLPESGEPDRRDDGRGGRGLWSGQPRPAFRGDPATRG